MAKSGNTNIVKKESWMLRIAKKLPESNVMFIMLFIVVVIASFIFQGEHMGVDGNVFVVNNMLSRTGLIWFFYNFIPNFVNFPPLGVIIVGAIGFLFAEKVGLLGALIKKVSLVTSERLLLPMIVFLGIFSAVASDAGYIVLIPLAGALYAGIGKHPLIGIMAAFMGVAAGFGANLIPVPTDALLGTITEQIAYEAGFPLTVNPITMNLFFGIGSTILLTILITFLLHIWIEKSVSSYEYIIPDDIKNNDMTKLSDAENKGLKTAGISLLVTIGVLGVLILTGVLSRQESYTSFVGGFIPLETAISINPLVDNIIVTMIILFIVPSIFYGRSTGAIKNHRDYVNLTVTGMKDMSYILVFAIFAGNFLAIFSVSGLAILVSNGGAALLLGANITNPILLMVAFIFISGFVNMFMGSAAAKWNILAPVFIPMLIMSTNGELTADIIQAGYRVGDSSTNIISPLMAYMGVIILACKKYVPEFEFGDLMAMMMPYSLTILFSWTAFFVVWMMLGIPFGF